MDLKKNILLEPTTENAILLSDIYDCINQSRQANDGYFKNLDKFLKMVTPLNTSNRNRPCSCGSGKKFKKCCMELHIDTRFSAIGEPIHEYSLAKDLKDRSKSYFK